MSDKMNKKVVFTIGLEDSDNPKSSVIVNSRYNDGAVGLWQKFKCTSDEPNGRNHIHEAISKTIQQAISSKHDYGSEKVSVVIDESLNNCGLTKVTLTIS